MQVLIPYTVADAQLVSSTVPETDYAAWSAAAAYAIGARCIRATTHRVYERLIAGTTATAPESDPVNWIDVGPTNRWAMFDGAVGTKTTQASSPLSVQLALGAVNDIVLFGVSGATVVVTKPGGTQVSAVVPAATVPALGSTVLITGIAGSAGTYTIAVSGTGTLAVGTISLGTLNYVADTAFGMSLALHDFSVNTLDKFGNVQINKHDALRDITVPVSLLMSAFDQAVRILAAVRSQPCVWLGVSTIKSSIVYGCSRNWSLRQLGGSAASKAEGSIEIMGLQIS